MNDLALDGGGNGMSIREAVKGAPRQPGVYVFRDGGRRAIYVGKASSLRSRLGSYLRSSGLEPKTAVLMGEARFLEYTVTDGESEALLLEYNLIKEYSPKFNVRYRDDKRYPYIKITAELFPRVVVSRSRVDDGGRYFGPYPDGSDVRRILRLMKQFFGLRSCKGDVSSRKPCLNLQIRRCAGPCTGAVSEGEYMDLVDEAALFLGGETKKLEKKLVERMKKYSRELDYERAAEVRDVLASLSSLREENKISSGDSVDRDYVGHALVGDSAGVSVFRERGSRVVGHFFFPLEGEYKTDEKESVAAFIRQYYLNMPVPKQIIVSREIVDEGLSKTLSARRGGKVTLRVPRRGRLKRVLSLVEKNAQVKLTSGLYGLEGQTPSRMLARLLGIGGDVNRVEGFDVSNISGKYAVGSMVVFEGGKPVKGEYRRFRIKTVEGVGDVAMMGEIVSRRLRNKWTLPDVILVDGGRGQVNAARKALHELRLSIPVVGLAKEFEDVYVGGRRGVLALADDSPVLLFLMRVRDEAHRFAVTYHRSLRSKAIVSRKQS